MSKNGQTFVRITNREIYEEIKKVHDQVVKTNGKVKMHTKLLWALGGAFIFLVGIFINHLTV